MGVRGGKVYHYKDQATTDAQNEVAWCYRAASGPRLPEERLGFSVTMRFHVGRRQRRDVDNMIKLVLDALTDLAWKDDSQVTEIYAKTVHGAANPRTEVIVTTNDDLPDWNRKVCDNCGEPFRTYKSWSGRRYCSIDCRTAALRVARQQVCAQCEKPFTAHSVAHGQKYCSRECSSLAHTYLAACAECGTEWRKARSSRRSGRDFCTQQCQADFWRKRRREGSPGTCRECGAGTSRKEYTRCNACRLAAQAG
jgi:Holliday junction resolvase RusA-like endonuclease